jgi:predicted metalloprotease with PDZ domain
MQRSMFTSTRWLAARAFAAFAALGATALAGTIAVNRVPTLTVTLSPGAPDTQTNIPYVDVHVVLDGIAAPAGRPFLEMPIVFENVQGVADALANLQASDANGPLHLTVHDDTTAAGAGLYRHWTADRDAKDQVTISYRVPITNAPNARGAAPPLELRTEKGGFSGSGAILLILPETKAPFRISANWDLSKSGDRAIGFSTLGPGDATLPAPEPASFLASTYVMGGQIAHYPADLPKDGFASAWQGTAPFDTAALMRWTNTLYDFYLPFFHAPAKSSYAVFLRSNPINAGGGVEVGHSFVGTFGPNTKVDNLKITLAHEMVHTFVGALQGDDELSLSWYSEGLAVYYERLLPLRAGQITPDRYLADINETAARYYTDLLNDTPNDKIAPNFWADTRIRVLPYDRGSLYFAVFNEQIRKATGGKRSLDDLVLTMIDRRAHGLPTDENAWVQLLQQTLGDIGVTTLHDMLAGKLVLPESDAFGPCFTRTTAKLRRYELGFDPAVLIQPKRIVRGLVPNSAAAQAGLRDGDEIVKPVPQDGIQADQRATLALLIRRGATEFAITYLPRGEVVDAYQWQRVPGKKDDTCRKW